MIKKKIFGTSHLEWLFIVDELSNIFLRMWLLIVYDVSNIFLRM